MDAPRFDHLSRRLGARLTRRSAIARAAVAVAGTAGASGLTADMAAASSATCRGARRSCTRNAQCCSGHCETGRDIPRARRNKCLACVPGATLTCGATCCPAGSACIDGACVDTCVPLSDPGICLLTARQNVQPPDCLTISIDGDSTCIDDVDCASMEADASLTNRGCIVGITTVDGFFQDSRGRCAAWKTPDVDCP
jgi:hypothetical protein